MKKIIFLITASTFFAVNLVAQDVSTQSQKINTSIVKLNNKYCAAMKDSKLIVVYEEKELTVEATLTNGTRITPDGYLVKKEGTRILLKEGECIDKDGNIAPNPKDKAKKDNKDGVSDKYNK